MLVATYNGGGNRPLLAPGGQENVALNFTLPYNGNQVTGTYYLIVEADAYSAVPRADNGVRVAASSAVTIQDTTPPAVASFSPTGPTNQNIASFQVGFSKPIQGISFTPSQVTISGPNGTLDSSTFQVTQLDARTFRVTFPSQSVEGVYNVTLGTGITDLSGNALPTAYQASWTIDKHGAHITVETPSGTLNNTVASVDVTFSKPINAATFTPSTITLTDPLGHAVSVGTPFLVSSNTYRIPFAAQNTNGTYTLAIGPTVYDLAGNSMDQNQDGVNGDPVNDVFHASFTVALPVFVVDTITPQTAPGVFGQSYTLSYAVHNTGTAAVPANWTDYVFVSSHATLDGSALLVATYNGGGNRPLLAPGAQDNVSLNFTLPYDGNHPTGSYYVIVETDANGAVTLGAGGTPIAASAAVTLRDTTPPAVASFSPTGPTNQNISSFQVGFSKPIALNTFTGAQVTISGPGGTLDPATFTVTQLDPRTFRVNIPSQSVEGVYNVTLGTGITDLSGNALPTAYQASWTIDKHGAHITVETPSGTLNNTVASVDVTFSKPINAATFTPADIALTDPLGHAVSVGNPFLVSGNTYRFTFAAQNTNGTYTLAIGPTVYDLAGNAMDQNQDGVNGDSINDVFHASFTLSLAALVVDTLSPSATSAVFGDPLSLSWVVHNNGTLTVPTNWTDSVYLSKTQSIDSSAVLVATYDGGGNRPLLAPGASQSVPVTFNLPFNETQTAGTYYLIVQTDSGSAITEAANAATIAASVPITLTLPLEPDLAASNVQGPDQTIADPATVTVSWTVSNIGEGAGRVSQWVDEVIASPNTTPGSNQDVVLGTYVHNGLLAPGTSYSQTETINLPPAFTGHYHLLVFTDADDQVLEYGRKANNVAAKPGFFDVMPAPYADLVIPSVVVPPQAYAGQPLTVTWTVANQGIGTTSIGDWNDTVYLATNPDGTGQIPGTLTSFEHFGFLAVNGSYQRTGQIAVPNGITGNVYVVVTTGGPFEFIYSTNDTTISAALPVTQPPTPDLVVTSVQAPTSAAEGTPIDVTWTVANQGQGQADGAWVDRVYLQEAGNSSAPVVELGQFTTNGPLAPGTSYTRTYQVALPAHINDAYTVFVTTDYVGSDNSHPNPTVYEGPAGSTAVTNDTTAAPSPLAVSAQPRPDLQVVNIQAPSSVPAGSALSVTFDVLNQGTVATNVPHWVDRVYLSLDTTIDPGSLLIGEVGNQSALEPGQEYQSTAGPLIVPERFRGNVYIIVDADYNHQVDQWPNGAHDFVYQQIYVNPLPLPDLVTSDVIVPTQVTAGATIPVTYTVTNLGAGATLVNNWTDTIWLMKTLGRPNPNHGDVLLASVPHTGSLDVRAGYDQTVNITIPAQLDSGTYYITPWVDPYGVVLQDELATNTNPDDPTQINNDNYKNQSIIVLGALPDLVVTNVQGPAQIAGGNQVTINWTVKNEGIADALQGGWGDRVYLSNIPNPNFDPNNPSPNTFFLGQLKHGDPLAEGASYTASLTVTLSPSAQGLYWVVIANSSPAPQTGPNLAGLFGFSPPPPDPSQQFTPLKEVTTANNTGYQATAVTAVPADLKITNVSIPSVNYSGESMTFSYTVTNVGTNPVWSGTQSWTDFLWLTADSTFIRDRASYLGSVVTPRQGPLNPGDSYVVTTTVTLPQGTGETGSQYYLWIDLDAHNDLSPLFFPYQAYQEMTGWWPGAPANADPTLDLLSHAPVNAGDNSDLVSFFTHWAYENPTNNRYQQPLQITYREADLQITNLQVPAGATSGQTIPVTYTVTNEGNRATRVSSWTDGIYLSHDDSLDPNDTQLTAFGHNGVLQPGASYTATVMVTLPQSINGDFHLIVYTDKAAKPDPTGRLSDVGFNQIAIVFDSANPLAPWDLVSEATRELARGSVAEFQGEGNNLAIADLPVVLAPPPDLQVTALTAPTHATVGGQINVSWTVTNTGGDTVPGQEKWQDVVYLSRDTHLDIRADLYLGTLDHGDNGNGFLGASQSYSVTDTFTLPAGLSGPFYVIVVTNPPLQRPQGDLVESNYVNNDRPSDVPLVIDYPPPSALQVSSITIPQAATVGEPATITWTVTNTGQNPASGTWSDAVYFSPTTSWAVSDPFVGTMQFTGTLLPGQSYTETLTAHVPPLTPGAYYVIVRTDIFDQVYEGTNRPNGTSASPGVVNLSAVPLVLGVPLPTTLDSGQERLFQVDVPAGQTLKVTATAGDATATMQLFASAGVAPTTTLFDASSGGARRPAGGCHPQHAARGLLHPARRLHDAAPGRGDHGRGTTGAADHHRRADRHRRRRAVRDHDHHRRRLQLPGHRQAGTARLRRV